MSVHEKRFHPHELLAKIKYSLSIKYPISHLKPTINTKCPRTDLNKRSLPSTVAGKGKISEPSTGGTSKLDWRCFEYY